MAEKFERSASLQEFLQAIKSKKCCKSLSKSSEKFTELSVLQKFTGHCENLSKKLGEYRFQNFEQEGPERQVTENERNISSRDEILCNLNLLWDIFSCFEVKKYNCPLIFKILKSVSADNGCFLKVLKHCLNCNDHFIVFQSYKVLCGVFKCFPDLVTCDRFQDLIKESLKDNNSRWLSVYTAEIVKSIFVRLENSEKVSSADENVVKSQQDVCCVEDKQSESEICLEDIKKVLCCHWLELTNHFLGKLLNFSESEKLLVRGVCEYRFDDYQQIIVTMLSCGKTFLESCDFVLANQQSSDIPASAEKTDLQIDKTLNRRKHARVCENECLSTLTPDHSCKICLFENTSLKNDSVSHSTYKEKASQKQDCKLKLFEKILIKLVEIDHQKCLLQFSRTVFQFLNDFADVFGCCGCLEKANASHLKTQSCFEVCSVLLENSSDLMENIPSVVGEVCFGGQDNNSQQSTLNTCSSHDEVCLRKILLFILKLILVFLNKNDSSCDIKWQGEFVCK